MGEDRACATVRDGFGRRAAAQGILNKVRNLERPDLPWAMTRLQPILHSTGGRDQKAGGSPQKQIRIAREILPGLSPFYRKEKSDAVAPGVCQISRAKWDERGSMGFGAPGGWSVAKVTHLFALCDGHYVFGAPARLQTVSRIAELLRIGFHFHSCEHYPAMGVSRERGNGERLASVGFQPLRLRRRTRRRRPQRFLF